MGWLSLVPTTEPDDETEVAYPCHCPLPRMRLRGGGAPSFSPHCHGEPGELWLWRSSYVGHGSPFWMLSQAMLGRWDEPLGRVSPPAAPTPLDKAAGARCPPRWGQRERGWGRGIGTQDPTRRGFQSLEADVAGIPAEPRKLAQHVAQSAVLPPGSFPTEAACDQRTSRSGVP